MCSGQLSLLPSAGREMSSSLRATGYRPSVADWGGGMSASCKPRVQLFADTSSGWPHSALRYHYLMPISCHFRDCKALQVAMTHVRSAITSIATFTFKYWSSFLNACHTHMLAMKYSVSQKRIPDIIDCNLETDCQILIVFAKNISDTTGHEMTVQVPTSPSFCSCTTWKTRTSEILHFYSR